MTDQIVLGSEDVEYVTSALTVYIDYLAEKHSKSEPAYLSGPWLVKGGKYYEGDCIHISRSDITTHNDVAEGLVRVEICGACGSIQKTADAMNAVRDTAKGALSLRQRIVKEWGYDPTFEG